MSTAPKMTAAQMNALRLIANGQTAQVETKHKTVGALVRLGLVSAKWAVTTGRCGYGLFGRNGSQTYQMGGWERIEITESGRNVISLQTAA